MKDITPETRFEGQRGQAIRTRTWRDIVERWHRVPSFAPMLRFVESVAASRASSQLFPSTSMFELLVSDTPDFRIGDSTLRVTFSPSDGTFKFHHHSYSGHEDEKICSEEQAVETFWLFARVKFGILREKQAP